MKNDSSSTCRMDYSSILTEHSWSEHAKQRFEERCGNLMCIHNCYLTSSEYVWFPDLFDFGYRICHYRNGLIVVLVLTKRKRHVITFMSNMNGASVDSVLLDIADLRMTLQEHAEEVELIEVYQRAINSAYRRGDLAVISYLRSKYKDAVKRRVKLSHCILDLGRKSMSLKQRQSLAKRMKDRPLGF